MVKAAAMDDKGEQKRSEPLLLRIYREQEEEKRLGLTAKSRGPFLIRDLRKKSRDG
jgi:hypothetical protein